PNENKEADDSMDIDWENTAGSSSLILNDGDDTNNNKKRRSAVLTPCVLLVKDEDKTRRCNNTHRLRSLKQLIGTWEIDGNAIKDKNPDHLPGVCDSHFQFDMKDLHKGGAKSAIDSKNSRIHYRICLFC